MKVCKYCLKAQPLSEYHFHKTAADRLSQACRACNKARCKAYQLKNKDKVIAQRAWFYRLNKEKIRVESKEWHDRNREHVRAKCREYHYANRERRKADMKVWQQLNADKLRPYYAEKSRRRFATMRKATPKWANPEKILSIYFECQRISEETGIKHHVDHIVPLVSDLVCGLHVEHNLQIMTATDNLAKSNKFAVMETFASG